MRKPLGLALEELQALEAPAARSTRRDEHAERLRGAAADAAAQLMELRQAEALGVLDDHHGGVRHVDADLDDGGRDQHADGRPP